MLPIYVIPMRPLRNRLSRILRTGKTSLPSAQLGAADDEAENRVAAQRAEGAGDDAIRQADPATEGSGPGVSGRKRMTPGRSSLAEAVYIRPLTPV